MLAYGCGIGIGGRNGGGFEGCVSDGICGAGGRREKALTVETRRAACDRSDGRVDPRFRCVSRGLLALVSLTHT
jgi:hypothetical protein